MITFLALTRTGTIFSVVREITPIKNVYIKNQIGNVLNVY